MTKKKLISIAALLTIVAVLAVVSTNLLSGKGKSNKNLDDFLVADTAAVDRLVLTQSSGYSVEILRDGDDWKTADGTCVQQEMIDNILHTFTKIAVRSYVPKSSVENLRNNIRVSYKKVQIFQNGKWVKTWWIGASTPDHYGTYALLETPDDGISETPVILEMRGLRGSIESRFTADPRTWLCTSVFHYAMSEIKSISLKHSESPERSFSIVRTGAGRSFQVKDYRNNAVAYDTLKLVRYLDIFKKVHFESPNYTLNQQQIDSLKKTTPYYSLRMELSNGEKVTLDAHRIKVVEGDVDMAGNPIEWDVNRMWAMLTDGSVVKIQYYSFDPVFVDIGFFTLGTRPIEF
jgi:hypothetical protein